MFDCVQYAPGIVEKIDRMTIFIWYGQSRLQKFITVSLFLELIENMLV